MGPELPLCGSSWQVHLITLPLAVFKTLTTKPLLAFTDLAPAKTEPLSVYLISENVDQKKFQRFKSSQNNFTS